MPRNPGISSRRTLSRLESRDSAETGTGPTPTDLVSSRNDCSVPASIASRIMQHLTMSKLTSNDDNNEEQLNIDEEQCNTFPHEGGQDEEQKKEPQQGCRWKRGTIIASVCVCAAVIAIALSTDSMVKNSISVNPPKAAPKTTKAPSAVGKAGKTEITTMTTSTIATTTTTTTAATCPWLLYPRKYCFPSLGAIVR